MTKLRVKNEFSADLDIGRVAPGEYTCKQFEARGTARNSKQQPAVFIDGLTVSIDKVNEQVKLGNVEILTEEIMESQKSVVVQAPQADEVMSVEKLKSQVNLIQHVMREVMQQDQHYGIIPGCKKPSLWKPGAETLSLTFRLAPYYEITEKEMPNGHREYVVRCSLKHINSGAYYGEGVGSCSTMEGKYRYRDDQRKCPVCGKEAIIKGKEEFGGGWLCFKKKEGCGAKFKDGDDAIEGQAVGRSEYDNPADYYNTVLKMAKKRAHIDATLTATAASDIFTQDIEDMVENGTIKDGEKKPAGKQDKKEQDKKQSPPKPATKAQFDKLTELCSSTYSGDTSQLAPVATHYRKGAKLSFDEAQDLIDNWQQRLDEYEAFMAQQNPV